MASYPQLGQVEDLSPMSKRRPLAFSDRQLQLIMTEAASVPPRSRSIYLRSVSDLLAVDDVTDASVANAVSLVRCRLGADAA
jgi:hypothetical protein